MIMRLIPSLYDRWTTFPYFASIDRLLRIERCFYLYLIASLGHYFVTVLQVALMMFGKGESKLFRAL